MVPERKKSPEAVNPSCARSERANPGYGHQKGMAVGGPTLGECTLQVDPKNFESTPNTQDP